MANTTATWWGSLNIAWKFAILFGAVIGVALIVGTIKYLRDRKHMSQPQRQSNLEARRGRWSEFKILNERPRDTGSFYGIRGIDASYSRGLANSPPPITRPGTAKSSRPTTPRLETSSIMKGDHHIYGRHSRAYSSLGGGSSSTLVAGQSSPKLVPSPKMLPQVMNHHHRSSSATIWPSLPNKSVDSLVVPHRQTLSGNVLKLMPSDAELNGRRNHGPLDQTRPSTPPPPPPPPPPLPPLPQQPPSPPKSPAISPRSEALFYDEPEATIHPEIRFIPDDNPEPGLPPPAVLIQPMFEKSDRDDDEDRTPYRYARQMPRLEVPDSGRPFSVSIITNPESKTRSMVASVYAASADTLSSASGSGSRDSSPEPMLPEIPNLPDINDPIFEEDRKSQPRSSIHSAQHSISHLTTFTFPAKPAPVATLPVAVSPLSTLTPTLPNRMSFQSTAQSSSHRYSTSSGVLSYSRPIPSPMPPIPSHTHTLRPPSGAVSPVEDEFDYYFREIEDTRLPQSRFSEYSHRGRRSMSSMVGGLSKETLERHGPRYGKAM